MAARVLREAVHEVVDLEATVVVQARERVVEHRDDVVLLRERDDLLEVRHLEHRVRRRLEQHELRARVGELARDGVVIVHAQHRGLDPELRQEATHRDAIRPVRLDEDHDAVAALEVAEQREPDRGHARADRDRVVAALELGGSDPDYLSLEVPGKTARLWVMIVDKVSLTPERYPRRPGVPRRRPLGGGVTGVD